jgi:hypothetical protein
VFERVGGVTTPKPGWRDQPRGLACAVVAAFAVLTAVAFALAILVMVLAVR